MFQPTGVQYNTLLVYRKYRKQPPSFEHLLKVWVRANVVRVGIAALLIWAMVDHHIYSPLSHLCIGLYLGSLLRSVVSMRDFVARWPAISEVINWERVDELLKVQVPLKPRFQLRLATLIVVVVLAAALLGLNATSRTNTHASGYMSMSYRTYGFPYPFFYENLSLTATGTPPSGAGMPSLAQVQQSFVGRTRWDKENLIFDLLLSLGFLLTVKTVCERRFSRRERQLPTPKPPESLPPQGDQPALK